jgi:hypothetical protein
MSLWYVPLSLGVLMFLVGLPLIVWQVIKGVTTGVTEIEAFGIKVKSPYVSAAVLLAGAALVYVSVGRAYEDTAVKVGEAAVSVDGRSGPNTLDWHTPCPATVEVGGTISAVGRGTVTYQFLRKVGLNGQEEPSQIRSVDFTATGTIAVVDRVTVPVPEGQFYYTDTLRIISPSERRSEPVGFTVWCDPNAGTMPPGMPPPPSVSAP